MFLILDNPLNFDRGTILMNVEMRAWNFYGLFKSVTLITPNFGRRIAVGFGQHRWLRMLLVGAVDTKSGLLIIGVFERHIIEVPAILDVLAEGSNPGDISDRLSTPG